MITRKVGKKWKSAGSATVYPSRGKFTFSFKPTVKGRWQFVAVYLGDAKIGPTWYDASWSPAKIVTVK